MTHPALLLIFMPIAGLNFLVGAIALTIGVRQQRAAQSLREHGIRVPGVVARFQHVSTGDFSVTRPVVRFRTVDGQDVETLSRDGPRVKTLSLGQQVWVVYDPQAPRNAAIGGASGNAGCVGGLFIFVGSGFLLGGLVFLAVALLAAFLT